MRGLTGIAVLGCGSIAHKHARWLRSVAPEVPLFGASRFPQRARDFARATRATGWFPDYASAINDPRVSALLIATPPARHLPLALAAIAAGRDVIVEKPAFHSSAACDEVGRAARLADVRVLVAENYAYKPIMRLLQDVIGSGQLGDVLFVLLNALKRRPALDWRGDQELAGGGALFEGGVHWVHMLANLGLAVESVHAMRSGCCDGPERSMAVTVQYEQGGVGTLLHSWEAPSLLRGLRLSKVTGTAGSVTFESNGTAAVVRGRRCQVALPILGDVGGYRAMLREFVAVLRGDGAPRMSLALARQDLAIVEQAYAVAGAAGGLGEGV